MIGSKRRTFRYSSVVAVSIAFTVTCWAGAQDTDMPAQELKRLRADVAKAQLQVETSQRQLAELQQSLNELQERLDASTHATAASGQEPVGSVANSAGQDEQQAMMQSQIATLNQSKVESSSKYPVSIHGLVLLNGFYNSSGVDSAPTPAVAFTGAGNAGASLRQTSFGVDAHGPTLGGASSRADFDVDFLGNAAQPLLATATGILRLRTAHATLEWPHTRAFFQFDKTLLNPEAPTSLVAVAQPSLAWSGNLWQWIPQAGLTQTLGLSGSYKLEVSATLMDIPDPPALSTSSTSIASQAERSRWPGTDLHLGLSSAGRSTALALGVGAYFSPHKLPNGGGHYDAWAAALDWRIPLPGQFSLTGNAYRGLALGGLGAGAYKDVISRQVGGNVVSRPLDDVGGWTQLKYKVSRRLEFNAAIGLDQVFAKELRSYPVNESVLYATLARNRTIMTNVIWSPSAYLLLSAEYRRISSYSVALPAAYSNIIGIAAGYKF